MKTTFQQSRWKPLILSLLFFAGAFTVGIFLPGPTVHAAGAWIIFMKFGEIFGLLGAIYGAIYALDKRSQAAKIDQPIMRIVVCAGLGAVLVHSLQVFSDVRTFEFMAVGAGIAGCLGLAGWRWAKHVPF